MLEDEQIKKAGSGLWCHRWGVPIAHALLWIIGMLVTTDMFEVLKQWFPNEVVSLGISMGGVASIFFLEVVFSFLDILIDQKVKFINKSFLGYIALLIVIFVIIVALLFGSCYFLNIGFKERGQLLVGMLIIVSAFAKGMEIWLQNNWDKYNVADISAMVSELTYSV